ncbi:Protein AAR2 like protein [Argiope bruennichi]|uniref:Protein AAR2 homolog n=1 Tax=Argiope bruennichi TaxID=94029 RepID=A0A8T0FN74_ARGBR|nr:Protein AAR2 like protein [Argiope bruennichi]
MASSSNKRHSSDKLEMSPEKARKLFDDGGVLIVLNLPIGSVFGIDMKIYQVGEKFLGLKMIPPGLHFIHYSAVSKDGNVAPRKGFFYFFSPQEIVMKKWDNNNEDLNSMAPSGEEKQRIRENLPHIDKNLGPYPYQILKQWTRLTCNISDSLVNRLQPECGSVSSVTEFVPQNFPIEESAEPDSTTERRFRTLEEKYLPNMKQVPGTEIRFTEIPKNNFIIIIYDNPDGVPAQKNYVKKHGFNFLGGRKTVEIPNKEDPPGRIQRGLQKHEDLMKTFLTILHYQLKEIPSDFFVDITSSNNFLVNTLQVFFENVKESNTSEQFKKFVDNFRKNLTKTLKWDFETIPDDELPVVVEL